MSIQVCLISWMNFNYKENWGKKKLFLKIQGVNIMYPNGENTIVVPKAMKMDIITSIDVCPISRVNINYKENGEMKSFSCKSKASISCVPMRRTWL